MKRCPKCNRTYSTDTQKFCTHDGGLLFMVEAELNQTVQFDSSKVRDAVAKPTTRDLTEQQAAAFDPEATVVSSHVSDGTQQVKTRDTGSLEPPPQTQYYGAPPSAQPTGPEPPPVSSGPIPPSPTSAPLPPTQVASSGPIAQPSGPIPPPPQAQAAAAAAHAAQPMAPVTAPKKKSKLPLILGILGLLLVFFVGAVVVAGYFFVIKPRQEARDAERDARTERTSTGPSGPSTAPPGAASNRSTEPPPYSPPPNAVQFVNSTTNLDGKLLEHYVGFSFYYPNTWQKDPEAGVAGAMNFAKVERRIPPDFTQENFAVGWYSATGTSTELFKSLAENMSRQLATGFPEYRKVSEGPTRAGVYDGYEFRFQAMSRNTAKGDLTIWGRVIFVPPPSGENTGVTLLMLATSLAPELESVDDIGVKGELPMVLESFRFGRK